MEMGSTLRQVDALRSALSEGVSSGASELLAQAVVRCCEELIPAGEVSVAIELLAGSQGRLSGLSPEWVLRIQLAQAEAFVWSERCPEGLDIVRRVAVGHAELLNRFPDDSLRRDIIEGTALWLLGRTDEAIGTLVSARRQLLRRTDTALLARCTMQLSAAHWMAGDFGESLELALDALVAARRAGDGSCEAQALTNYARLVRRLCRWTEAQDALRKALELTERLGLRGRANHSRHGLALLLWKRGRLEAALQLAERCCGDDARLGQRSIRAMAGLLKCQIMLHQGRYDEAMQLVVRGPEWDSSAALARASILAREFAGEVALEQGNGEDALKSLDEALSRALALAPKGDIVAGLRRRRAECFYLLERFQEAYEEAKAGLEHCRGLGDRYEEAATYRILGLSTAAVGKPDEAKKWFDGGFSYYDDIETPYEWGKLWMAYGDWLRGPRAGAFRDPKGALEAYHAARDHFEGMGAEGKLAEANRRLEKLTQEEQERTSSGGRTADPGAARHAPRRPRRSTELERLSLWAKESFGIVTRSKALLALLDDVRKLAPSNAPILVIGESGTGKELVARGIHALSGRKGQFMAINASSLPREIIESELFGHVVGSFTGATREKPGMFEVCDKGTVFLDEIAEMSFELQSRLLRFLETGESRRVGANANIGVDTRIIAATNRDRAALERGENFRLDLYYRLAHAVIVLPPLRHRGEDIELLAGHFLDEACASARRQVYLSPAALGRLNAYAWPGNVRQLRAVIKRVVLLSADGHVVTPEVLQLENVQVPTTLIEELEQAERRRVGEALAQARGSRTDAARLLGMPRTTLINKIRRYGLK